MSRITMGMLLALVAIFITGCAAMGGAAPSASYRLAYHQPGKLESSYVPGYGGRKGGQVTAATGGWSIFEKDRLIYFVERGRLTVYKPREGLLVQLPLNMAGVKEDVDGTKNINFVRASDGSSAGLHVIGVVHPEHIQIWDNAAQAPGPWYQGFSLQSSLVARGNWMMAGSSFRGEELFVQGAAIPRDTAGGSSLERSENFLRATVSAAAVPLLSDARLRATGYDEREAQKQAASQQRTREADARRIDIQKSAEARFLAAAAAPKVVGMTVCSPDNRLAYVEQIAGPRLKLLVSGRATAVYGEFGEYGPYALIEPSAGIAMPGQALPIKDAHFLFRPVAKQIRFTNENQPLWDESRFWGACAFR